MKRPVYKNIPAEYLLKIYIYFFSVVFAISGISQPVRGDYLSVELFSEVASIQPGKSFNLGLRFNLDKDWHIYWKNPGDAGMPVSVEWNLPKGFKAGEIQWPYPKLIKSAHLANFSYDNEVLFIIEITPPEDVSAGTVINIAAKAKWLVCKEDCTPGDTELKLALPVRKEASILNADYTEAFYKARFKQPLSESGWAFTASRSDSFLFIDALAPNMQFNIIKSARFFPLEQEVIQNAADQQFFRNNKGFRLKIPLDMAFPERPEMMDGVIVSDTGWRGPLSEKAHNVHLDFSRNPVLTISGFEDFIWAVIFAFLGGLILNLMPCVLPVLSIKILGFVHQSNGKKNEIFKHGLIFSAGVMVSFWILAIILLLFQSAGNQIGWGFQLQQPVFLFILIVFFFLFGLNLFGVFEFGVTFGAISMKSADRRDLFGSFINGMIATLVATPCTAPFMGSALGFAVTHSPLVALTVFTFLGLGMSSPYLLLSAKPSWLKFVPKPGEWMENLKQFFGFLLLGTAIWLLWVLGLQRGNDMVIEVLFALLLIGIGAWIYGKWGGLDKSRGMRHFAEITFMTLIAVSAYFIFSDINQHYTPKGKTISLQKSGISWQKYSKQVFEQALKSDKPVFIDFTAAWCLSCQVNEKVALDIERVKNKFSELGIIAIKADWTSRDDEITQALSAFRRNSVPLYVLYGKDRKKPLFLPEVITPGIVLDALKKMQQ